VPDLLLASLAVTTLAVYARGVTGAPMTSRRAQLRVLAFAGGFALALGALSSPVEQAADSSLPAHMAQHVVLLTVAPPLLVAGRPGAALARGLPARLRPWARRRHRSLTRAVRSTPAVPAVAVGAWVAAMAVWHLPGPFDGAVHDGLLHGLEHGTFLAASLLLWSVVAQSAAHGRAVTALLCLFATGLACTALGAALVVSTSAWYPAYAQGSAATALADQQLAGIVMWGFANLALVVAAAVLFGTWLVGLERRSPARLRPEPSR